MIDLYVYGFNAVFTISSNFYLLFVCVETLHHLSIFVKSFMNFLNYNVSSFFSYFFFSMLNGRWMARYLLHILQLPEHDRSRHSHSIM